MADSTLETIFYEAQWLKNTGEILPNLALQFKILPRVILEKSTDCETQIDTEEFTIVFKVKAKGKIDKSVKQRIAKLIEHTNVIMNHGFKVTVDYNGKLYEGTKDE
jgi:hypothetical protein